MTDFSRQTPASNRKKLALDGYGMANEERGGRYATTTLNRTPPNHDRRDEMLAYDEEYNERRQNLGISACGHAVAVDDFTYDMLRRASSINDGNAFFGPYDPALAREHDPDVTDLSLQYGREAGHTLKTLDGLNIVTEDLVDAAFLGVSARRLAAESNAPSEERSMDALVRIAMRLLCDAGDAESARKNIEVFLHNIGVARRDLGL